MCVHVSGRCVSAALGGLYPSGESLQSTKLYNLQTKLVTRPRDAHERGCAERREKGSEQLKRLDRGCYAERIAYIRMNYSFKC